MMNSIGQAELLILEGDLKKADELLLSIITEEPDNLEAILFQGIVYTETGREDQAIKALEYYNMKNDANSEAWEALGCAWFRKGFPEKGKECLLTAYSLRGNSPSILRNLGIIEEKAGNSAKALSLLKRSYLIDAKDYRTVYALAFGYLNRGEKLRAQEHFERLLTMTLPDDVKEESTIMLLRLKLDWL
ncbi:MAG: tetratricopeptide repeat protein [Spirochaetales bacterium]|nr:tetratricopeptide repeat protein [Spirochaetales bacterium]